jgi:hypothetical protein
MAAGVRLSLLAFDTTAVPQYARPTFDVSAGTWTPSAGSDLWAMLDETSVSETDSISSSASGSDECELRIRGANRPVSGLCYLRVHLKRG